MFKTADRVLCIDPDNGANLIFGKIYTVFFVLPLKDGPHAKHSDKCLSVNEDSPREGWCPCRFVLAKLLDIL